MGKNRRKQGRKKYERPEKGNKCTIKGNLAISKDIFSAEEDGVCYISVEDAHRLFTMLNAVLSEAEGTGEEYISSHRLNIISEIEEIFLKKVLDRVKDKELNTFDLYQDINGLFAIHQMHMESLSLVHKVRKKQKC